MKELTNKKTIFLLILSLLIISFFYGLVFGQSGSGVEIINPLEVNTFKDLIIKIIDFLQLVAFVVVPLVIVIAAYIMVTSLGEAEKINQAKKATLYALVGALIIALAKGLANFIFGALGVK